MRASEAYSLRMNKLWCSLGLLLVAPWSGAQTVTMAFSCGSDDPVHARDASP